MKNKTNGSSTEKMETVKTMFGDYYTFAPNFTKVQPLSNVQRKKKYIENLKINGYYDAFKKKRAEDEKARRQRLKNSVATLSYSEREQALRENRLKNRERAKKFRVRKKIASETSKNSELLNSSSCESFKIEALSETSSNCHERATFETPKFTERRINSPSECCKNEVLTESDIKCLDRTAVETPENNDNQNYTSCESSKIKALGAYGLKCSGRANSAQSNNSDTEHFANEFPKIKVLNESLLKCRKRSKKIPQSQKKASNTPKITEQRNYSSCESSEMDTPQSYTSLHFEHSYKTYGDLAKAVAKTERTLPASPSKRNAVIATLFYSLDEKIQQEIIRKKTTTKKVGKKGISTTLFEKIQTFYERDDISRMSQNVDDLIDFVNPTTGQVEIKTLRNLVVTLKQAYELFMEENEGEAVKLAKFCSLRPVHVKLCGEKYSFLKKQVQDVNIDREYINSKANGMESLLHVDLTENDDELQLATSNEDEVIMKCRPSRNCNTDREDIQPKVNVKEIPLQVEYAENLASDSQDEVLPALWNQHQIFGTCLPICLPSTYPPPTSLPRRKPSFLRTKTVDLHTNSPIKLRTNTIAHQSTKE